MNTATLLLNHQGIKAVRLTEELITVWYADGMEPIHIQKDDELYPTYRAHYEGSVQYNIEEAAKEADKEGDKNDNN